MVCLAAVASVFGVQRAAVYVQLGQQQQRAPVPVAVLAVVLVVVLEAGLVAAAVDGPEKYPAAAAATVEFAPVALLAICFFAEQVEPSDCDAPSRRPFAADDEDSFVPVIAMLPHLLVIAPCWVLVVVVFVVVAAAAFAAEQATAD